MLGIGLAVALAAIVGTRLMVHRLEQPTTASTEIVTSETATEAGAPRRLPQPALTVTAHAIGEAKRVLDNAKVAARDESTTAGGGVKGKRPRTKIAVPMPSSLPQREIFRKLRGFADAGPYDEDLAIENAREAVKTKRPKDAIRTLDEYDEHATVRVLFPEAETLRIEALVQLGNRKEAIGRADEFIKSYPHSPFVERVKAARTKARLND